MLLTIGNLGTFVLINLNISLRSQVCTLSRLLISAGMNDVVLIEGDLGMCTFKEEIKRGLLSLKKWLYAGHLFLYI